MANGAQFLRADLHIHSFGEFGSYDVKDSTMTPEAIVDMAMKKGLSIISITDHNEIQNSSVAINHAKGKGILVIPGIEVSTTQGHLLVYFSEFKDLRDFYGKLTITADRKTCQEGIVKCLDYAKSHNGIGVLAHIELESGFEKTIKRYGPQMDEVFIHDNLFGLEISSKSSVDFFTELDADSNRKKLFQLRKKSIEGLGISTLPKLMSSDAHTLDKLGTNADGNKKLTRIKVDELNYHAFKVALLNHSSRVRLEDFIPEQRPLIKSIRITGGLLDEIDVSLSSNLTCIIGSRGAGKSTFLEAIRETSGNKSKAKMVDSEVWPDSIDLAYQDETGQLTEFRREKFNTSNNLTDPQNGISKVLIESYGQGETADTIQHSDENPMVLISFLDSFLDIKTMHDEDQELINKLMSNTSECRKRRLDLLSFDETKKALSNEKKKMENLIQEKAGELAKFQNALLKEREIRSTLIKDLHELVKTYRDILGDQSTFDGFSKLNDDDIIIGKDYFNSVKELVSDFSKIVASKSEELNKSLNEKIDSLKVQLKDWSGKEKEYQDKIDKKKKELKEKGIPFDLGKINQISNDIIDLSKRVKSLETTQLELKNLVKERKEIIKERKDLKNKIYYKRYNFALEINKNLKNSMDGLFIDIEYQQGKFSKAFELELKSIMDWRTVQVPKALFIAQQMSPMEFADCCKRKNKKSFEAMKNAKGERLLTDSDIESIIKRLTNEQAYEDFEHLEFEDRPRITVTKVFYDDNGKKVTQKRSISRLSLGQQQSVLLGILMLSKSKTPLIIDQPEDNLDSEFIFKTIVKNLRKIKETRQVIIVTHNPNITVLGDAELIIPLKSTNTKTHVIDSGSIDRENTRKVCCEILEGGINAFKQRQAIYGI